MRRSTSMTARCVALSLGLLFLPEVAAAVDVAFLVQRAGEFGKEVARIEASRGTEPLEQLLRRGNELAAELKPVLEQLSDQDYISVEGGMRGYVVNREEVILVEPDTRFFSKLAGAVGTPQDRLYFEFMLKVRPNGYWPGYVTRQTDAGGCVEFGIGSLAALYRDGSAMLPKLGRYYRRELETTIADIGREVTTGTCACGKTSTVVKELRTFLEANPTAPIARTVKTRMKALERGADAVTENCVGGR